MQLRDFGKTGVKVSPLGFGMMRMPLIGGRDGEATSSEQDIDVEATIEMVRAAIDQGVNYLDTAYNYFKGGSERVTAKALADGYREKIYLATKSPVWLLDSDERFEWLLDKQLGRLETDYVDFYMMHALNREYMEKVRQFDAFKSIQAAKDSGKAHYIGFSFHDSPALFKEILDLCDWDFCQIQLNYADEEYQAGLEGLRLAAERGLGIVIMEGLRGGALATPPSRVQDVFDAAQPQKTAVEWALDYLWDMPEVSTVISGMRSLEQVNANIAYAEKSAPGMLSPAEKSVIAEAAKVYAGYSVIPCTGCNYCAESCSEGVAIPYNFDAYNKNFIFDNLELAKGYYHGDVPLYGAQASACIGCQICEDICPQNIPIAEWMPKVEALLR